MYNIYFKLYTNIISFNKKYIHFYIKLECQSNPYSLHLVWLGSMLKKYITKKYKKFNDDRDIFFFNTYQTISFPE